MSLAEIEKTKGKKLKGKRDDLTALKVNTQQMARIIDDLTTTKNRLTFQWFEMENAL